MYGFPDALCEVDPKEAEHIRHLILNIVNQVLVEDSVIPKKKRLS